MNVSLASLPLRIKKKVQSLVLKEKPVKQFKDLNKNLRKNVYLFKTGAHKIHVPRGRKFVGV